jgi:hypothetical protein
MNLLKTISEVGQIINNGFSSNASKMIKTITTAFTSQYHVNSLVVPSLPQADYTLAVID